jgi:tripartite-type tricarboxylate transporter receptor subunit TctC
MSSLRRVVTGLAGALLLLSGTFCATAAAESVADFYSGKQVKIVIGASMGGSYGFYAQMLARHITPHLPGNPTVVVQAMPGSGGNKSMNYTYVAGPQDGSVVSLPLLTVVQETLFNPQVRFDAKGYNYIGRFADVALVATAHKRTGIRTIEDAKKKAFPIGTLGPQNQTYVGPRVMNEMAGTKFNLISGYRGTTESYQAMERGEVDIATTSWNTLNLRHKAKLESGELIPIFTITAKRHPELPNVQAIIEFGNTDIEKDFLKILTVSSEIGRSLAGPPGMPKDRVEAWRAAMAKAVASKAFRDDVFKRNGRLNPISGEELTQTIHAVMNLPKSRVADAKAYFQKLIPATAGKQ